MDKKIIKSDDTELKEYKCYQGESPIFLIKQQYLLNFLLVNKILNISLVTKILKKIDLYVYSVRKKLYIKVILMKIDIPFFVIK